MARLFPALQPAPYQDINQLVSPEFQDQWWLLGLALVNCLFNYFLGVEGLLTLGLTLAVILGLLPG